VEDGQVEGDGRKRDGEWGMEGGERKGGEGVEEGGGW